MIDYNAIEKYKPKNTNFFRFKKFSDNSYLITNDLWFYCFLNKNEFNDFIKWDLEKIESNKLIELKSKFFIKIDWFEEDFSKEYILKNSYINIWPSLHIVVLTLRCNHSCRYCHANAKWENVGNKDMTIDTARKVVDTIFFTNSNFITIEFQWWEPLLNFDVLKFIVEYSKEKAVLLNKNLDLALVSNLSLMDEEKLKYLIDNNVWICTSLDWKEEVHNFNRVWTKWNSFEKVTYWIKRINQEYSNRWIDKKMSALVTTTKKTLDDPKWLIDTYLNLWLNWIFLRPLNPYWYAKSNIDNIWYNYKEFNDFYNKAIEYILQLNKNWIKFSENYTKIFLQKILNKIDPWFLDEISPCWASIWQVAYNYDWKIYTCDEWRMFAEIWDENFCIWVTEWEAKENYISMIKSKVTESMVISSTTDFLPGYYDSVYKPYIWVCPISNYNRNWNIFPNFSLDNRIKISTNILDNIFSKIENEENKKIFKNWCSGVSYNKNCI